MPDPSEFPRINWKARGYFGAPASRQMSEAQSGSPWSAWVRAFWAATEGDHTLVHSLHGHLTESDDPVFVQACHYLIGDAGPTSLLPTIREDVRDSQDLDLVLGGCGVLAIRGELADVPLMLDAIARNEDSRDSAILGVYISDMLVDDDSLVDIDSYGSFDAYKSAALDRHQQLVEAASESALIFLGQPFSVIRLAELILDALCRPAFRMSFRRRFEAATGVDCSGFYKNENLQPLAAAAIVEAFLDSTGTEEYEEGARYFFGHRLS